MRYFPIFLDLQRRTIFIAGGGAAAANKLRLFSKTSAKIYCSALDFSSEMKDLFAAHPVHYTYENPVTASFHDAVLIIAATESDVDKALVARANAAGILVNAVDKTDLCDFITPSIVDRDPVVVAIGTEGSAPVLARRLRERVEGLLPENLGVLADFIGSNRERAGECFPDTPSRRAFWEGVIDGDIARFVLSGEKQKAQTLLDAAFTMPRTTGATSVNVLVSPEHPDDLTLRALRALQDADMLLLCDGVPTAILDRARRDSTRVNVRSLNEANLPFAQRFVSLVQTCQGRSVVLLPPQTADDMLVALNTAFINSQIDTVFLPVATPAL